MIPASISGTPTSTVTASRLSDENGEWRFRAVNHLRVMIEDDVVFVSQIYFSDDPPAESEHRMLAAQIKAAGAIDLNTGHLLVLDR